MSAPAPAHPQLDERGRASFPALGTTAVVLCDDPRRLAPAQAAVAAEVDRMDRAASRFRPDSDLALVNGGAGTTVAVGHLFCLALEAALQAAELTNGDLDPTMGQALVSLGYDIDFPSVPTGSPVQVALVPAAGWRQVDLDAARNTVRIPAGSQLDLGATAKALCADRAANAAATAAGCGVLVSLGGDIAAAGPAPAEGWAVLLADRHDTPSWRGGPTVVVRDGGLATSGTTARRWQRAGRTLHHVIDPATGAPVTEVWRTVTVAAGTCLAANIAATTSIIRGRRAIEWLAGLRLPARLVGIDDTVELVGGWPPDALR